MKYFEKIMEMRYYAISSILILSALIIVGFATYYLIKGINNRRKTKWLKENGFERGVVDFCNHTGYKNKNGYFTDNDIEHFSLKEIKQLVEEYSKNKENL